VENSSLLPWLSGTALLHSLLVQGRRGRARSWNLILTALTFVLCVFATFLTRSGFVQSIHAFARSPVGYYFLAFMATAVLAFAYLMYRGRQEPSAQQELPHPLSRTATLPLASVLFLAAAFVILVGTLFPTISGALLGRQAAVGPSFYEQAVGPLAQIILVLMGVCPWLTWRGNSLARLGCELLPPFVGAAATVALLHALRVRSAIALLSFGVCAFAAISILALLLRDLQARRERTGERATAASVALLRKNRRRYGAYTVHLAVVLIAMGVAGSSAYQEEALVARVPGERIEIRDYVLEYRDDLTDNTPVRREFRAVVDVYRNGKRLGTLRPQRNYYWGTQQWLTEVAVRTSLREDLYVSVIALEQDGLATFQVLVNPLVVWLWIGGAVLLLGGLAAWWPSAVRRTNR
jgi:cytochrome c-type biogenesis protein CcmF